MLLDRDAHAEQQLTGARLGGVAVELGKAALQLGRLHVIVLGRLRIGVDGVLLLHHRPHLGMTHHHDVQNPAVLVGELILAQVSHAFVLILADIAARRFKHTTENLHEGRLAGAVGANQPVAVTVTKLDADILEQGLGPELLGDVGRNQHGQSFASKSRWPSMMV